MTKKWILITGASSGIGEAFAHVAAQKQSNLILVARRVDRLEKLAASLTKEYGSVCHVVQLDLTEAGAAQKLSSFVDSHQLSVDVLFNNAGFGFHGLFLDIDPAKQRNMIDLNISALMEICHAFGQKMLARRFGRIINNASVAGFSPTPYYAVYGATKAFVVSFSQAIAKEWEPHGVTVTALCPGATDSEFVSVSEFKGNIRKFAPVQTSMSVARYAWEKGVECSAKVAISGFNNQVSMILVKFLPRSLVVSIIARVFKTERAPARTWN